MISRRHGALCAAAVVALAGGCASNNTPSGATAQFINGGATDTTHTGVVGILLQTTNGAATCSGSLIAPNLVLTARHCVSPVSSEEFVCQTFTDATGMHPVTTAGTPYAARSFGVTTQTTMPQTSRGYVAVAQVIVPANSTNVPLCGKDIALLRLATPITDVAPVTPRLDIAPTINEHFTAVGYGATNGSGAGAGTRRSRSGLTIEFVGLLRQMGIEVIAAEEMAGDDGTCQGDSGGPPVDEAGQIFGVLSRGAADTCGQEIYTRVDSWASWLREQGQAAATAGGLPAPAWLTPQPAQTLQFGAACSGDHACVEPLSCLIVGGSRVCTNLNCSECPAGFACGMASSGDPACAPDPNFMPPQDDAGVTPADDVEVPPADDAQPPTGAETGGTTPGAGSGSCSVSHTGRARTGAVGVAFAALVALVTGRRRRRGRSTRA